MTPRELLTVLLKAAGVVLLVIAVRDIIQYGTLWLARGDDFPLRAMAVSAAAYLAAALFLLLFAGRLARWTCQGEGSTDLRPTLPKDLLRLAYVSVGLYAAFQALMSLLVALDAYSWFASERWATYGGYGRQQAAVQAGAYLAFAIVLLVGPDRIGRALRRLFSGVQGGGTDDRPSSVSDATNVK
jgi:hypothetical protein